MRRTNANYLIDRSLMKRPPLHPLLLNAGLAVVYIVAAKIGLSLAIGAEQVTAVWPPTGISLAAVILYGRSVWPGIFVGAFLANFTSHEPLGTALGIGVGNTLEALIGAYLLQYRADFRPTLERIRDVGAFIVLAAGVSTTVSATIGVLSLCLGGVQPWHDFGSLWLLWWLGDAMGNLVVAPLLLTWLSPRPLWKQAGNPLSIALLLCLVLVNVGIFTAQIPGMKPSYPLEYAVFPLVIGAAFARGQLGAGTAAVVTSLIAIVGTVQGTGPFSRATPAENLVLLQLFMGVVAATGLLLGGVLTERKHSEVELQRGEERLRFALEAGRVGVFDWDIRKDEVFWSDDLFGPRRSAPREGDRSLDAFMEGVHPDDRSIVSQVISRSVQSGERYDLEYRSLPREEGVTWYAARGKVLKDRTDDAERMIGVCADVTARKQLEESLRTADRQKDEFVAMLAHELRNPLAPIRNAASLLQADGLPEASRRLVEVIERQAHHMARLLDDLLDVSRITRGQVTLRKCNVDLGAIVSRAVDDARGTLRRKEQQLAVSIEKGRALVHADPARIYQIASNLLQNASKYTEAGGEIRVTLDLEPGFARLVVADTGVGIDPEFLPRIFHLFTQEEASAAKSEGGLGIGLTLVKTLVEMHGGSITAVSDGRGQGSVFTVRIPLSPASEGGAQECVPETGAEAPAVRRRVLIVDDNEDAATTLAELAVLWGHEVRTAGDGLTALHVAREMRPDAVLLDIGLPGMDGHEVARRLRDEPDGATLLIVAVTGYGREEDRHLATESGFDHHCTKPVEPEAIRSLLATPRLVGGA